MNDSLLDKIYDKTNKGLDIILSYYPQAHGCDRKGKFFKLRGDEKTASAAMKEINGVWKVTDFGDDAVAMSPVDICMREERLDFKQAVHRLADRYNVSNTISFAINKPTIEQTDATAEEKDGEFTYELNNEMTDRELEVLGPMVKQETCKRYNYYSVKWYSKVKNRKKTTVYSNSNYPIFLRDCGTFRKIYQPLNPDKAFRFFYDGNKPKDFLNGFTELKAAYETLQKDLDQEEMAMFDEEKAPSISTSTRSRKLPEAILCSGERDALNCAGMGYLPLWLNSETARLDAKTYNEIMKRVDALYNIPDMDETGIRKGHELALQYVDIYTIYLPNWLPTFKDNRGRSRKDLRDFVELKPSITEFKELVRMAMPCRFWDKVYTKTGYRYEINTLYLLHFLKVSGFGKIIDKDNDNETLIFKDGYKVKEVTQEAVVDFVINWARENNIEHDIQNLIINSARVSPSNINKIDSLDLTFTNNDVNSQLLFFDNKTLKITADKIEEDKYTGGGSCAWIKSICKHEFKRLEPAFTSEYNPDTGYYKININHTKSHYFRFLINASRIYWKEELLSRVSGNEDTEKQYFKDHHWDILGPRLTEMEQVEQMLQLQNKMFAIGYLLHSYKSYSKAWCVWVMENKITEEDESSGGSGKTFMLRFLTKFKNMETLNGRNKKLTESDFFMDRITESTDIMLIDDADKYFNFNYFYSMLTDNMVVNYKNAKSKEIAFKDSPKIVITSNFPPPANDGSTARRILNCVFSDYYHKATDDNGYPYSMRISDDFGYELHNDAYKWEWWNEDYNFCIDCLQFYLSTIPHNSIIEPPMGNVDKRMRAQLMGTEFMEWAEVFFSEGSENLDKLLDKSHVKSLFDTKNKFSSKGFTNRLRAFCKNCDYIEEYNPKEVQGYTEGGRIIRKTFGTTTEYVYIKTKGTEINQNL